MNLTFIRCAGISAFAAFAMMWPLAQLHAINVQPVIIDLESTGRNASGIVTLQNTFSETVPIEVTVHPVRVVNGQLEEVETEEAEDLLVFPAQAVVPAGGTQAFRVQWVGDPAPNTSEHYYVTVAQLPVALESDVNAIQVLHRFRVLVNVGARGEQPDLTVESVEVVRNEAGEARPVAVIANRGTSYGYVARHRMTVSQVDENGQTILRETYQPEQIHQLLGLGMIPSAASRSLPIGIVLPSEQGTVSIALSAATSD